MLGDRRHEARPILRLGDDLDAGQGAEHRHDALPQEESVVGDHDPGRLDVVGGRCSHPAQGRSQRHSHRQPRTPRLVARIRCRPSSSIMMYATHQSFGSFPTQIAVRSGELVSAFASTRFTPNCL